jgi:diaminohydroxyphosphoribosylaminopyrimidine deaminase/5-amino-6-(5-phosphoribosylamino)uracil reductase
MDLSVLLRHLCDKHGATNVLVEGGAGLFGAFFQQGLMDEVVVFVAPAVMGDDEAVPAVRGLRCGSLAAAKRLSLRDCRRLGDDVLLRYRVRRGA